MTRRHALGACLLSSCVSVAAAMPGAEAPTPPAMATHPDTATLREWVGDMKHQPRGPFQHIRWFCKDGSVLEPKPYACENHGGGVQHGEWSEQTRRIRAAGYPIANVLADLTPEQVIGPDAESGFLSLLLLEKFLIAFDNGWIFRQARAYRGALQEYNEQDSATAILTAMLEDPGTRTQFLLLREATRLLPHGVPAGVLTGIRGLSTTLADQDPGFSTLRDKIHVSPDAEDALRVREYLASASIAVEMRPLYETLAQRIDNAYTHGSLTEALSALSLRIRTPKLLISLRELSEELQRRPAAADQFRLAGNALVLIRENLHEMGRPAIRLRALNASLVAGVHAFTASRELLEDLSRATRAERLVWLQDAARALYGLGLLTRYEHQQFNHALESLRDGHVPLTTYRNELSYLESAPDWAARRLKYHFGDAIERLSEIEPLAAQYLPDKLRSTPLLFYSNVLESLLEDAAQLAGIRHRLFGTAVSSGLRPLNPGLARGVLVHPGAGDAAGQDPADAIWLVPETRPDLPRVAGILTAGEGNALSHVQLLARNLGIPNVVVSSALLDTLLEFRGRRVVVAVSPGGQVRIELDGPAWQEAFSLPDAPSEPVPLSVNVEKLDLADRQLLATSELGSHDSGRRVGPKAAQVGELSRRFPGLVSPGLAIPFAVYRDLLNRPRWPDSSQSMFDWMREHYAGMDSLDPAQRNWVRSAFLVEVRAWILEQEFDPQFISDLGEALQRTFGEAGSYGVFVRSDTNVEDLPGFTGAGLNRTVPNVVGTGNILSAIREVWASPFSERAFTWRQGVLDQPEHVYASVLLHQSVPAEKSGVMVTTDLDSGDPGVLTIVTNLGVGGGVEGQAGETLRVSLLDGSVRLLSSATARRMRRLLAAGGSEVVPAPAPEQLLQRDEISQLVALAHALPGRFPPLLDATGQPAPADIEFGFYNGQLQLFQIRPFVRNAAALRNRVLADMDRAGEAQRILQSVDMHAIPPVPGTPEASASP